jgi:hypothetical protein
MADLTQLWHNASRKSVQGLSISLFTLALLANAFVACLCSVVRAAALTQSQYTASIFFSKHAYKDGHLDHKFISRAMPYLVTAVRLQVPASLAVLTCEQIGASLADTLIFAQYFAYRGWEQPDPRDRLEPGLAAREALMASESVFQEELAEVSRSASISELPTDERTRLLA